jgi:hypothetical protein
VITPLHLAPESLLVNAIECIGLPNGVRLVMLVLQGAMLQKQQQHEEAEEAAHNTRVLLEIENRHGETALHAAVRKGDAKVSIFKV